MQTSLHELHQIYEFCAGHIQCLRENMKASAGGDQSGFWKAILDNRLNYPSFNEMLVMRRSATYALGDRSASDLAVEQEHARAAQFVMSRSVPTSFLASLEESAVGAPFCFEFNARFLSASCITNALTAYRIIEWLRRRGLNNRPLRVLEIGAGYGQVACQLIQRERIASYAICDLPENLFLSAFYLQATFPDRGADFANGSKVQVHALPALYFLTPPCLKDIEGEFDLVINSYSFQEMTLASVQSYFDFIATALSKDGIFYSLNAHGKDEVAWPSDYPFAYFTLLSFLPVREMPFQMFATTPYEAVLCRRTTDGPPLAASAFDSHVNALGVAIQLGLGDELQGLCDAFVVGGLSSDQQNWLSGIFEFVTAASLVQRNLALGRLRESNALPAGTDYLAGLFHFVEGRSAAARQCLASAISGLTGTLAELRSHLMLTAMARRNGDLSTVRASTERAERLAPHLMAEFTTLAEDYFGLRHAIARGLLYRPTSFRNSLGRLLRAVQRKLQGRGSTVRLKEARSA